MHFTTIFSMLLLSGAALATRAGYDTTYDNASGSMDTVACSDGSNGLAKRFPTFGDVPTFPFIGGASAIAGWNDAACGSCWTLTYNSSSVTITAIDHADDGFNLSQEALDALTNGDAVELGAVTLTAEQVDKSACGL